MLSGPPEEGPKRAGRTASEGLAKSSTCEMVMQVSRGHYPEVSPKGSLRPDSPQGRGDTPGIVPASWA